MGFPRQEYWSGLPCPTPGDLPNPGTDPLSLMSPALADRFFTTSATWEAHDKHISVHKWIHCGYYFEQIPVRSIRKNERFCSIFTYSFSDALLSLNRSEFLAYIIFLLSEELPLTFLARQVYWQKNSLSFYLSEWIFLFHFWRIILQDSRWFFFSQRFRYFIPLFASKHGF